MNIEEKSPYDAVVDETPSLFAKAAGFRSGTPVGGSINPDSAFDRNVVVDLAV
jgi:hypothetical protein